MTIKIALAGNPNCGKTTLFNALTGSNQYVGNWPGVTVEKKEGKLKKHEDVKIVDLPGIYSLSPYTLEEVVARNFLIGEHPDAILNIVDGTSLERNLYLSTQLMELGIPVVLAVNMMDLVQKNGDTIDISALSKKLGVPIVEISALKQTGIDKAASMAVAAAKLKKHKEDLIFSGQVTKALTDIENAALSDVDPKKKLWYAVKLFERDQKVMEELKLDEKTLKKVEEIITKTEDALDDDSESIITNDRYQYIEKTLQSSVKKQSAGKLTISDKIDKIVTNRVLGLPIFAVVMFIVYYVSMVTIGSAATDWANDGLFGDGFHLFGNGTAAYEEASDAYTEAWQAASAFVDLGDAGSEAVAEAMDPESESFDPEQAGVLLTQYASQFTNSDTAFFEAEDEETLAVEEVEYTGADLKESIPVLEEYGFEEPDPADYGTWIPGIPVLIENLLDSMNTAEWMKGLVLDGIVAGVGAVLGFVPQMLVLFFFLAFLESCGYMARVAFVMDRIFRKFGLSGKSFIPILIGTGCGVPGIMASRTIESQRDRRMTVMTTTFIPCSAKVPFIALISGAIFGGSAWISTGSYFIGLASIIVSGIILKKTKMFSGDPAPFVMELPAYHWPTLSGVLRSMWERGSSFIKKAGTIILLSTIFVWFTTYFGFTAEGFRMLAEDEIQMSLLASVGNAIAWIFTPLGWGNWQAAVASITGLVAKENIVGTLGILYGADGSVYQNLAMAFTSAAGFSFLVFNLLCAPCFAAIGAIKREMNNAKWTWFAIGYQCVFAYLAAFIVYQLAALYLGYGNLFGALLAGALILFVVYLLFKPAKNYEDTLTYKEEGSKATA